LTFIIINNILIVEFLTKRIAENIRKDHTDA